MALSVDIDVKALHGHMKGVTMIKYNRDGDLLFSTARDTNCSACCWYTKTGELLGSYTTIGQIPGRTHDMAMIALDVNRESTLLATASAGQEVLLWSVETGKYLGMVNRDSSSGSAVGFSHDDTMMMVATKGRSTTPSAITIYNVGFPIPKGGEDIAPLGSATLPIQSTYETKREDSVSITWAAWGPTNSTIYFSEAGMMHILDVESNKVILSRHVHESSEACINRFTFDPSYMTLATASKDETSCLLDYRDLRTIQTYQSDVGVFDVSISPTADHVLLGGGMEASNVTTQGGQSIFEAKFYHKARGSLLGKLRCHFGTISATAFSPDGTGFATGSYDGLVKLYKFGDTYKDAPGATPLFSA